MTVTFKKAVKFDAKGRVALVGPAGSGKSYTMLVLARLLAGKDGKVAAIDTEHGSLSKYASLFDFDVIEMGSYSPENFTEALTVAEKAGYDVFCCDSLSHFWMGKDGALEFVDEKSLKLKDKMGGWKEFRPHERAMVDRMIASPCHIICTMRTKTDYQEIEENGKKKRVKVGLAPVQRDGMEYEFDLVGYMDDENNLIVDKTRCPEFSGRAIKKPDAKALAPFQEWLKGEQRPAVEAGTPKAEPSPQKTNGEAKTEEIIGTVTDARDSDKGVWLKINGEIRVFIPKGKDVTGLNINDQVQLIGAPRESQKSGRYFLLDRVVDVVPPAPPKPNIHGVEITDDDLPF